MSVSSESNAPQRGLLLVISGPAGVGKTTLCDRLEAEFHGIKRLVTTTSRPPRPNEVDGVDYHFVAPEDFEQMIAADVFVEWAKVHDRYYGSQRSHIESALSQGQDLLLNIDIQGSRSFRQRIAENPGLADSIATVFIRPKDLTQIEERLRQRGTDDAVEIQRRLLTAQQEITYADSFDYIIVSASRNKDYSILKRIYQSLRNS